MKTLLVLLAMALVAGGALAQGTDEFGLWRVEDGTYLNDMNPVVAGSFDLFITLHNPSIAMVGGFEVGFELPPDLIISDEILATPGINFGEGPTDLLVGFGDPLPVTAGINVLVTIECVIIDPFTDPWLVEFHSPVNPSIPGFDGPVYSNGEFPDQLIMCQTVTGMPGVFVFAGEGPVGVELRTWSGVKALFD